MERTHFSLNVKSILLILFLSINGCATTNNFSENYNPEDPYEKSNRKVFEFNKKVDNEKESFSKETPHDVPGDWFKGPF